MKARSTTTEIRWFDNRSNTEKGLGEPYRESDYIAPGINRRQDSILKIIAKVRLWNMVVKQIPRGCVWNLQKRDDGVAKLSEFLALGEEHFGSFRAGLLKRAEDEQYLNGVLSALEVPPGLLEKLSVEDKGLLCMRWLANKEQHDSNISTD